MNRIGITAISYNISDEIQRRFKQYAQDSIIDKNLSIMIYLPNSDNEVLDDFGRFNKSKALNNGIKELINCGVDTIICTDIDIIIPPKLIEYSYNKTIKYDINLFSFARFVNFSYFDKVYPNWNEFIEIPMHSSGFGGWNCMNVDTWYKSGGWPEELYGWGFEDVLFHDKLKMRNIDITTTFSFPLLHINHPPRTLNQMESHLNNIEIAKQQPINSVNWLF